MNSTYFTGGGNGNPLQYSCLENPMDRGAWQAAVHAKGRTRLSDFTLTFHFHALEQEMATHSSVLAWRIPGTGEPGGLLSMGSQESDMTEVTQQQQQHISLILPMIYYTMIYSWYIYIHGIIYHVTVCENKYRNQKTKKGRILKLNFP